MLFKKGNATNKDYLLKEHLYVKIKQMSAVSERGGVHVTVIRKI